MRKSKRLDQGEQLLPPRHPREERRLLKGKKSSSRHPRLVDPRFQDLERGEYYYGSRGGLPPLTSTSTVPPPSAGIAPLPSLPTISQGYGGGYGLPPAYSHYQQQPHHPGRPLAYTDMEELSSPSDEDSD